MTRQEMFDVTGYWNFVFCREIKDLSDNTFVRLNMKLMIQWLCMKIKKTEILL